MRDRSGFFALAIAALIALSVGINHQPAEAQTPFKAKMYSSGAAGVSVTTSNTPITFTDNRSGGDSAAFEARSFIISSRSSSSDTCAFDWIDTIADGDDAQLAPGGSFSIAVPDNYSPGTGYVGVGVICDSGTATFDIVAHK